MVAMQNIQKWCIDAVPDLSVGTSKELPVTGSAWQLLESMVEKSGTVEPAAQLIIRAGDDPGTLGDLGSKRLGGTNF